MTDLLPFHHTGVSVDALARLFLGRRFALKGSVDHKSWGTWPLGDAQRLYAAADACVVADLVVSIAEKEASEAARAEFWYSSPSRRLNFARREEGAFRHCILRAGGVFAAAPRKLR